MYSRTIDGEVTDFVSTAKVDFEFYTYNKVEIDQKDADTLQSAKDYADENFYDETESDARFVHLTGNEAISGTKTFTTVVTRRTNTNYNEENLNKYVLVFFQCAISPTQEPKLTIDKVQYHRCHFPHQINKSPLLALPFYQLCICLCSLFPGVACIYSNSTLCLLVGRACHNVLYIFSVLSHCNIKE